MQDASFFVLKNEHTKVYRVMLCVFPGVVLAGLLRNSLPYPAILALILLWPVLTGWTLAFRPNQTLQVSGERLLHKNLLSQKEKAFRLLEIREARFSGFSLLRYLILTGEDGKPIVRLEADMENMDRLVRYLKENNIPVNNT